LTVQR